MSQRATVCDSFYETKKDEKNGIVFLDLGGHYPNAKFTIVIYSEDVPNFPQSPEVLYRNKRICVTDVIKKYKGMYQIETKGKGGD